MARYIEVDFAEVTTKKAMAIRKNRQLSAVLGEEVSLCGWLVVSKRADALRASTAQGGAALHSPVYHLLPCDLRLPPAKALGPVLEPLLAPSLRTLLLFECVLAYMTPDASSALLRWFVDHMGAGVLGCVVYEMFGLNDAFGKVMVNNLKVRAARMCQAAVTNLDLQERNVTLVGAEPFITLDALKKRFYDVGFVHADAITLRDIRRWYVDETEVERVSQLELLDEVEELELVLSHYAVSWGVTGAAGWGLKKQVSVRQKE